MKQFDRNAPCPKCGSKDNLGIWTDGQMWCFGCYYFVKGGQDLSLLSLQQKLEILNSGNIKQEEKSPNGDTGVNLPSDYSRALGLEGAKWLMKYGITREEITKNHIGWSDKYESLIFPVFDIHDNLLLVQRRFFGHGNWPRYHTKGKPESLVHILGDRDTDTCVLVEDLLSAIKVGRQQETSPLWGSNLSLDKIKRLSHRFANLILWLDRDKAREAVRYKWKASPFFQKISIIVSEHDPKEYSDDGIATFLAANL